LKRKGGLRLIKHVIGSTEDYSKIQFGVGRRGSKKHPQGFRLPAHNDRDLPVKTTLFDTFRGSV
jgi:peptidyl-tRNA hydrolase